ncbi:hypothetical protein L6164_015871 [Bauhinia variegata]|uniref:Uncharacterized protein n=1 Tax=Bauhinia variegata TaxID=167791 RepID=A0ACB9NQQ8_BAUVA|nr:hypothetical protein L6164_015871 [Bauhinia variegata]
MQKEKEGSKVVGADMDMDMGMEGSKEEKLPPGYRFHPTDEELITYYLVNKISDSTFTGKAIGDVDLNKSEPWELPGKAKMGEKEWYFFSLRDRKYPTGVRTNRATNAGYWKTTGKDKEIFNNVTSELVGMKKTLVFYKGRAPRGEKSNWVMHEYRIHAKSSLRTNKRDEWVVCRVFQKSAGVKKYPSNHTRAVNPYSLEIGPSMVPPPLMQLGDPVGGHFLYGRNYTNSAELAEIARVLRGAGGSTSVNLPMQSPFNYPVTGGAGGCFTISGLNLNLGGGAATTQPVLRPMPTPPPQAHQTPLAHAMTTQHDHVSSNMMTASENSGYVTEMGNANPHSNRYIGVDHCMDLDNYWPSY